MKNFKLFLLITAITIFMQASCRESYTHFDVKFSKKTHKRFFIQAGFCESYFNPSVTKKHLCDNLDILVFPLEQCEEGHNKYCTEAIKLLTQSLGSIQFSNASFWEKRHINKYFTLLQQLKDRKQQIEELEKVSTIINITPKDIRTIFQRIRPYNAPPHTYHYNSETGILNTYAPLEFWKKKIYRCKAFSVNKNYSYCRYWRWLITTAQEEIHDDPELIDKLQKFSMIKEY